MNKADLRIVFMGTPGIASGMLEALITDGYNVVAGLCQPDKPVGRKQILTAPPVKETLLKYGIEVFQPGTLRKEESAAKVASYEPDLIVTCAYGKILPAEVLEIPKYGCLNVHASLLPAKRGAAPVQRAVLDGDETTGITIMKMDEGLDTGDIVSTVEVPIGINMHSEELFAELEKAGAKLLLETILPYCNGEITLQKQDDSLSTYCPPIKAEEGLIDWNASAFAVHKKIHAFSTWPGAYTYLDGKKVKIYDSLIADGAEIPAELVDSPCGTVIRAKKQDLFIKCGEGVLGILVLQTEGGKKLNSIDCAHNYKAGQFFGNI